MIASRRTTGAADRRQPSTSITRALRTAQRATPWLMLSVGLAGCLVLLTMRESPEQRDDRERRDRITQHLEHQLWQVGKLRTAREQLRARGESVGPQTVRAKTLDQLLAAQATIRDRRGRDELLVGADLDAIEMALRAEATAHGVHLSPGGTP